MPQSVRRILALASVLVLSYFALSLLGTFVQLSSAAELALPGAGRPTFWLLIAVFAGLLLAPLYLYFALPKPLLPPTTAAPAALDAYRTSLRLRLQDNPRLAASPPATNDDLAAALATLGAEADRLVKETASAVFVSTAVMQNGRLDGLMVLASQIRLLWRMASIYQQRPSPRQMLYLYAQVGGNVLFAENIQEIDFAELSAPVVGAIVPSLQGGIPGLQGISSLLVNSLANGAANAFLTLRVGLMAKAYCATLTPPVADDIRRAASTQAISLVSAIVKEQGQGIAKRTWGLVKGSFTQATTATLQGTKTVLDNTVGATTQGVRQVGLSIGKSWRRVKGGLK